jgi:hypothetical protein
LEILRAVAYLAEVVAAVAILVAALSYIITRKQFNFGVITSCTTRWQQIMPEVIRSKADRSKVVEERYVDLCNEELFYCKEGYVPKVVVREWLNGMVDYLPHYHGELRDKILKKAFDEMVDPKLLDSYPRVKEIFSMDRPYNVNEETEREVLIKNLLKNMKRFSN